jgi:hypothetical protein
MYNAMTIASDDTATMETPEGTPCGSMKTHEENDELQLLVDERKY